jgi:hypothetical protein
VLFLSEQHLAAAKLVRTKGQKRDGADRVRFVRMSNSLVVCARLAARNRGGLRLDGFDWYSLAPDWSAIEEQIVRLSPPNIESPPLAPDSLTPCII